jgi:hypothetical protein
MLSDKKAITVTEMGRRGGLARAKNLSQKRRSEIASKASMARWAKKNKAKQKERAID